MVELESSSAEETERVAAELARGLGAGDVVTVSGDLGTGKTTFVRGACHALGVAATVTSPTYAVGNRYPGSPDVSHLDLYRLGELTEADWADLEPYFDDAVVFVEWPEAAEAYLPAPSARVRLRHLGADRRMITVRDARKPLQIAASPC
jgi:tRNA threonylcarbamoyladenosine biosynthesis protein TsaE